MGVVDGVGGGWRGGEVLLSSWTDGVAVKWGGKGHSGVTLGAGEEWTLWRFPCALKIRCGAGVGAGGRPAVRRCSMALRLAQSRRRLPGPPLGAVGKEKCRGRGLMDWGFLLRGSAGHRGL